MASELRDHQHELTDADGNNGVVFGTVDTGYLTLTRPTVESGESTTNDRSRPSEDGRSFGRDLRAGKTVIFEMGVVTDHLSNDAERANLDYLDALEGRWTDDEWRYDPGAYAVLRSREAGQTWRAYGRPRRFEPVVGAMTSQGYSVVIADFPMGDDCWYADVESQAEVRLSAGSLGGLVAPLKAPLSTVQASEGQSVMVVGGSRKTWPVIEFHGPGTNPEVTIGGSLVVGLTRTLGAGEVVVVDPRPWERAVYRLSDSAGLAGYMSHRTPRMPNIRVRPGSHNLTLTGRDPSGMLRCVVRWRDARSRP